MRLARKVALETPLDSQVVLETVPYSDAVAPIHSEAALDAFLRLHPAGSSRPNGDLSSLAAHLARPRVVIVMNDPRQRIMQAAPLPFLSLA